MHGCFYCEPGSSCALGAEAMTPCSPGSVAPVARLAKVLARTLPVSSLAKCELCEPGKFQDSDLNPNPKP